MLQKTITLRNTLGERTHKIRYTEYIKDVSESRPQKSLRREEGGEGGKKEGGGGGGAPQKPEIQTETYLRAELFIARRSPLTFPAT